jgi:hypothetical protein
MATAGASIASTVREEEDTSKVVETTVDVRMRPIAAAGHRQQELGPVTMSMVTLPHVTPMPQQRMLAHPMLPPMPQQHMVASPTVPPTPQQRTAEHRTVAKNIISR